MKLVLDKGYVRIPEDGVLGTDKTVVNAARVSFDKAVPGDTLRPSDEKLIYFLAKHGHTSPFRHAAIQFEVYAPLMIARQWWKYVVGSNHQDNFLAWNESSRRYVTEQPEFYTPEVGAWRSQPDDKKQGSGGPLEMEKQGELNQAFDDFITMSMEYHDRAVELGVATEQARLFLPAYGMYVRWYWTISLQGLAHFLNQRMKADAQHEIQEYAYAVKELAEEHFPVTLEALMANE